MHFLPLSISSTLLITSLEEKNENRLEKLLLFHPSKPHQIAQSHRDHGYICWKTGSSSNGKSRRTAHETDGAGPRCRSRLVPRNHRQKANSVHQEGKHSTPNCRLRRAVQGSNEAGDARFQNISKTRILQIDFPDRVCIPGSGHPGCFESDQRRQRDRYQCRLPQTLLYTLRHGLCPLAHPRHTVSHLERTG